MNRQAVSLADYRGAALSAIHRMPAELRKALAGSSTALAVWKDITPLARTEWICWIVAAKKPLTKRHRIERTRTELMKGKRRPCCWGGCPHRL